MTHSVSSKKWAVHAAIPNKMDGEKITKNFRIVSKWM
jgi:hypothetical protein